MRVSAYACGVQVKLWTTGQSGSSFCNGGKSIIHQMNEIPPDPRPALDSEARKGKVGGETINAYL